MSEATAEPPGLLTRSTTAFTWEAYKHCLGMLPGKASAQNVVVHKNGGQKCTPHTGQGLEVLCQTAMQGSST